MARAHAARDIDDTLHLVRDRTELEIARYRIWVFATVTPMSLVVE